MVEDIAPEETVAEADYDTYQSEIAEDIEQCLSRMACQPILFAGSGLSKRYFNAPNWFELLETLISNCPRISKGIAYYRQQFTSPMKIGSVLSNEYQEWAWSDGQRMFPHELFSTDAPKDIYIKHMISEYLKGITPGNFNGAKGSRLLDEISSIRNIRPHAVITTNYDTMLEKIFDAYEPVIGEKVIRYNHMSIGEIFKIHGCVTDPESLGHLEKPWRCRRSRDSLGPKADGDVVWAGNRGCSIFRTVMPN